LAAARSSCLYRASKRQAAKLLRRDPDALGLSETTDLDLERLRRVLADARLRAAARVSGIYSRE
jgi:hypothetical protein